ncbi:hypothetical protein Tco_1045896 [Tanacetum coccineum]
MNRISSRRLSTITCVLWQCSQNISCVRKGKGLFGPNGRRGGKEEVGFDNFVVSGEEIGNCSGNGGRGSSIFKRGLRRGERSGKQEFNEIDVDGQW